MSSSLYGMISFSRRSALRSVSGAVAFLASWLKAVFFADNLALSLLFFFGGKWTFDVLYLVAERRVRGTELAMQLMMWSPLAATVTAFAGIVLLLVLRPVLGRSSA